jgi:hypothetical protein
MPKPPILPTINWQDVYQGGVSFEDWLAQDDENPEGRKSMEEALAGIQLEPHQAALLKSLGRPVRVVAIAECWCGDVVRHTPVLMALAKASGERVGVRFIAREDRPDLFARYLTNGGEAIPKYIFLSDQWTECGNWGPMPELCRKLISRGKGCGDVGKAREKVGALYEAGVDRTLTVQELLDLIATAACSAP